MQTGYYLGLDIGSNSVGYAVTDENYVIKKFNKKAMWGSHVLKKENNLLKEEFFELLEDDFKEKNKEYSLQENYLQKKLQKWMRIFLKD